MKLIILIVLSFFSSNIFAEGFDTADEAAVAGLLNIVEKYDTEFKKYEFMGVIYTKVDGRYYYSNTIGNTSTNGVNGKIKVPGKVRLIALYHNHPYGGLSEYFSVDDIEIANRMNVDSYILDIIGKRVLKYSKGDKLVPVFRGGIQAGASSKLMVSSGTLVAMVSY